MKDTVGILGDVHGNMAWMQFALHEFHEKGITTVLQVGDFGIYNSINGHFFLKKANLLAKHYDITLYVVPGNHEDWDYINSYTDGKDEWVKLRERILLAPRGLRWTWNDTSFVALGGAPSVDRAWRVSRQGVNKSLWWPEEAITQDDVDKVAGDGYADVMVAHDAPFVPSIDHRIAGNPMGFKHEDLVYAAEGRALMDQAFKAVKPKVFLHGHYHFLVNDIVDDTHILGLDCDGQNYSLGALYLGKVTATAWDISEAYTNYYNGKR